MAADDRPKPATSPPHDRPSVSGKGETPPRDPYAAGSFTFRRMARWQIIAMVIVLALLLLAIFSAWA